MISLWYVDYIYYWEILVFEKICKRTKSMIAKLSDLYKKYKSALEKCYISDFTFQQTMEICKKDS